MPTAEPRVDWDRLRADAEAIVDHAAADAESLIHQAESKALELVERAREHITQMEEDASAAGREQGYTAGKTAAEDELAPVITTMRELTESIRAARGGYWRSAPRPKRCWGGRREMFRQSNR